MAEKQNRVAEDAVEYSLFPVIPVDKTGEKVVETLEECLKSYMTFLSPNLINVIWQNESFSLNVESEKGSTPAHLQGVTNFGDNIEDEWFIVHLLFKLTERFPGLVAKVSDNDGEFLLIEAADSLPKWLTPEIAENRVYLYKGKVHVIPIPQSPSDLSAFPTTVSSVGDAVECIRTYAEQTQASLNIQKAIKNRVKSFPELMEENIHYTHSYVPAALAAILDERPQLVAPTVRAFYYRDPIDLRCCRTFQYFRPGTRVIHRTKITRCLYAQLLQQNFQADKRSGWIMPSSSNPKFKSHDLGMKLAHGFEILCSKVPHKPTTGQSNGRSSMPRNDARWLKYVKSLQEKNYFRGEMEGSKMYQELLENAWKFYEKNVLCKESSYSSPGDEILNLLNTVQFDIEERRANEANLLPPDDDSWLNLTPETLDAMMRKRAGKSVVNEKGDNSTDGSFDLSKIAESMKTFVGKVSGPEGAEFPGEEDDDEEIQFDGSGFISAMQEMFEFEDSDSNSSSGMSEYGWEDDSDSDSGPKRKQQTKIKRPPSLDKYMDIMDRELSKTDVGKSFEVQQKSKSKENSKVGNSKKTEKTDINEEDDDFQPVDVDLNIVKNMLESFGNQEGLAGPTSNILGSMGIVVPPNADNTELPADSKTSKPVIPPRPSVSKTKAAPDRPPPPRRQPSRENRRTPEQKPRKTSESKETVV